MIVAQDDPLWVTASASEQDIDKVKIGQNLTVSVPFDEPKRQGQGGIHRSAG